MMILGLGGKDRWIVHEPNLRSLLGPVVLFVLTVIGGRVTTLGFLSQELWYRMMMLMMMLRWSGHGILWKFFLKQETCHVDMRQAGQANHGAE
jgi:hypothetical protein